MPRLPRPAAGGTLDSWRRRPAQSHVRSAVLVVLVPLVACVLPLALHGFPAHGTCYVESPAGGLVDAIRRDGRICAAIAAGGLAVAGFRWWDAFDDPPQGRGDGLVLVLATLGTLVVVGVVVVLTLVGGAMTMPTVLWAVALVAVVAGDGPAPRTVALLAVAGTIVAALAATHDWGAVLAC